MVVSWVGILLRFQTEFPRQIQACKMHIRAVGAPCFAGLPGELAEIKVDGQSISADSLINAGFKQIVINW